VDAIVENAEYKTDPNRQLVSNPAVIESIVLVKD